MIFFLNYWRALWLALLVTVAFAAEAQLDTAALHGLPEVEVAGQFRPSPARAGAPMQRFERRQIEALGMRNLSEVVRTFAGATLTDYGGIGGLKTVSVRGLGARHTGVAYDGVSVVDAQSGLADVGRFSLDNVESVTLSIGLADDIFRTARMYASAGALQIVTARPEFSEERKSRLALGLRGGSFGLLNPYAHYERKLGDAISASGHAEWLGARGDYPFTLANGNISTRELRRNSDISSLRLEANAYGSWANGGRLQAKVYSYNSERGLPGSVILYNDKSGDRLLDDNFFVQAMYELPLGRRILFRTYARYNYSYSFYVSPNDNYAAGSQEDKNCQREYYASAGARANLGRGLSAVLVTDIIHSSLDNNFRNSPLPRRLSSLTVAAARFMNPWLTGTASVLATYMRDEVSNGGARPADRKRLSPAISLSVRPFAANALRLRASWQDIFRTPTFTDLYYLRLGNTNLRPERASQYNLGLTWTGGGYGPIRLLSASADAYYNKVSDKIVAFPTLYVWKMINMGEVEMRGLDLSLLLSLGLPHKESYLLDLSASYSYQQAIDLTNPKAKNYRQQIPYTPRNAASASAMIGLPWINLGYVMTATGRRYALPQNIPANQIDSYAEHNLSANKSFRLGSCILKLQAEVLNIAGANYDVIRYYPMPGRSFRLSINLTY
ncbi:MAG: TonB-dependent receptor [Tannerellaceae bacterium]|jgi:outer membrane receptor protein involved in Fe transport|nr:TonB-dependent receptor [Tannerellaceae bacterium]